MKTVRIISKDSGLGNQIQLIPIIQKLKEYYKVISDSDVYREMGVDISQYGDANYNFVCFGYDWKKFFKARLKYNGTFYGFKYRIKGKHIGIGYKRSLRFYENKGEILNNIDLLKMCFGLDASPNFEIQERKPEKNKIVFGISNKLGKSLSEHKWRELYKNLKSRGYNPLSVDHKIEGIPYKNTPTLRDLRNELKRAEKFIGTDSGVMHVADAIGVPMVVMFGATSAEKNKPLGRSEILKSNLPCSPCFNWGRIKCDIGYKCMDFEVNDIIKAFDKL